jgi:hypothetical protein
LTRIKLCHDILSLKQQAQRIKNIEGCKREKTSNLQSKPIKITADFSMETLKERRAWSEMEITSTLGYSTQQNYH